MGKGACYQAGRPEFDSLEPTKWKEITNSTELSSDLHIGAVESMPLSDNK